MSINDQDIPHLVPHISDSELNFRQMIEKLITPRWQDSLRRERPNPSVHKSSICHQLGIDFAKMPHAQ